MLQLTCASLCRNWNGRSLTCLNLRKLMKTCTYNCPMENNIKCSTYTMYRRLSKWFSKAEDTWWFCTTDFFCLRNGHWQKSRCIDHRMTRFSRRRFEIGVNNERHLLIYLSFTNVCVQRIRNLTCLSDITRSTSNVHVISDKAVQTRPSILGFKCNKKVCDDCSSERKRFSVHKIANVGQTMMLVV